MRKTERMNLLVVGDTSAFGRVVAAVIGQGESSPYVVRHTTYEGFRGLLSPRLLSGTDLFILELWRTYSTGLRAEGVAVAEELIRQRAMPLVVSPLSFGDSLDVAWYWDLGAGDSLVDRCGRLVAHRHRFALGDAEELRRRLAAFLGKPRGHEPEPNVRLSAKAD